MSYSGTMTHDVYVRLLEIAKKEYPNKVIDLRNVSGGREICNAKVVEFVSPETKLNETLVKAIDKATSKVNAGARIAIEQVSVSGGGLILNRYQTILYSL